MTILTLSSENGQTENARCRGFSGRYSMDLLLLLLIVLIILSIGGAFVSPFAPVAENSFGAGN